jgi:hypothetical protein
MFLLRTMIEEKLLSLAKTIVRDAVVVPHKK